MNEKNMLEQNRRDIMRHLGFRQTANAMDKIDPLPYPEAGESDIFSQRLAKGTLRHMTEAEFNAHTRGRNFGEWGQPVRLSTQPIADQVGACWINPETHAEKWWNGTEWAETPPIAAIHGDLFSPVMSKPAPAQQSPANAGEAAFGHEAWKYPTPGFERGNWEWPVISRVHSFEETCPLLTKASLKEIEPENCGPHP